MVAGQYRTLHRRTKDQNNCKTERADVYYEEPQAVLSTSAAMIKHALHERDSLSRGPSENVELRQ